MYRSAHFAWIQGIPEQKHSAHILYTLTSTVDSKCIYDIAVHHIHTNTIYFPIYDVKMTCQHYGNYIKKNKAAYL